jgi:hypothetical protein
VQLTMGLTCTPYLQFHQSSSCQRSLIVFLAYIICEITRRIEFCMTNSLPKNENLFSLIPYVPVLVSDLLKGLKIVQGTSMP